MSTLTDLRADREHWSYSSLNQFLNICNLAWAFQRLYKLTPEFVPVNLSFGSAFHRALETISLNRKQGKTLTEKDGRDLFADFWSRQQQEDQNIRFDEKDDPEALKAQGMELVACYQKCIGDEEILAVNQAFAVPLVDMHGHVLDKPLIGEFDQVVRKQGKKIVSDWKTSATRWPAGKPHRALQPTVYLYAASSMPGFTMPEFRYDIVVKNKTPVFEQHTTKRNRDQFNRMVELVKLAESMIAAEHFVPNQEGMFCKNCPFQTSCKSWHRDRSTLISVPVAA